MFLTLLSLFFSTGKVVYCYDGDTCRYQDHLGLSVNIRVAGIDAPELKANEPFAVEAKTFINNLIKGKRVIIKQYGIGYYQRPIVSIWLASTDIGEELIKSGYARTKRGYFDKEKLRQYRAHELNAKIKKIGIWSRPNNL